MLFSIIVIGILAVVSISVMSTDIDESRFDSTVEEMNQIKNAMIGNEALQDGGTRTSFGFLGDIGRIPTNAEGIAGLITKPAALPVWAVNTTGRFGVGWNGPYLLAGSSDTNFTSDSWGRAYVYDATLTPPTIISRGADGAVGGAGLNQDITVALPADRRTGNVNGFIQKSSQPLALDSEARLYSIVDGALTTTTVSIVAANSGRFQFSNVPFGVRSVMVAQPTILAPASASQSLGPIILTVDKPNVLVPSEQINLP